MSSENDLSSSEQQQEQNPVNFLEEQFANILDKHPNLTPQQSFHLEYCKLYIKNIKLKSQIDKTKHEIQSIKFLNSHKSKPTSNISHDNSASQRKKRIRRTANQIARHYVCQVEKCQKSYGSEGSLNQHMKLKHKDIFKNGYQ